MTDFIFLGSKITDDGGCSHEIKRHLLLGRKAMITLDSILKSRHYFADKGLYSQSCGFSNSHVWMWKLDHKESWALKNWCFQPVVLEKNPLDSKEIKEVNPKGKQSEYSLERLSWSWSSNNLATWCKELTHWKRPWCWERLKAGEGDDRGWDGWMASLTQWTWVWANSGRWWRTGKPGILQSMGSQRVGHEWVTEQQTVGWWWWW